MLSFVAVALIVLSGVVLSTIWAIKYYLETSSMTTSIENFLEEQSGEDGGLLPLKDITSEERAEFENLDYKATQAQMDKISKAISEGANGFLFAEYVYMAKFMVGFSIILLVFLGFGSSWTKAIFTTIAFLVGSISSIVSGWIGMKIAVLANVRTAVAAFRSPGESLKEPFIAAFKAGGVMGFSLVALGLLSLYVLIVIYHIFFPAALADDIEMTKLMYECVAGFGLGGSSIALFGRVGGGIYTKAADVGADLFKLEGLEEDDPRNPAVIADNVGDNVGDIAGMGADLFGSFAESSCAAMVVSASSPDLHNNWGVMCFPLLIASGGIMVCIITSMFATECFSPTNPSSVASSLKNQLIVSTVLMTPVAYVLTVFTFPAEFTVSNIEGVQDWYIFIAIAVGLWAGLGIGIITEYYTSNANAPTQELALNSDTAATNIIFGLALGYKSTILPVIFLAITIYVSFALAGMYGVACGALGILSTLAIGLTIDAYGPICDNAGGIAEMCSFPSIVRSKKTDPLDAAGNTTAAIGKGFAIGSAAMVSLALFGAFVTVKNPDNIPVVDVLDPLVFAGVLVGSMLPYWFSAMTMKSVAIAAGDMVKEVKRQFDTLDLMNGGEPQYEKCVKISTEASLREMVPPGALVMLTPLFVGYVLGVRALAGLLTGILCSGVQMAISASNSGGAWDNAKKWVEDEQLTHHYATMYKEDKVEFNKLYTKWPLPPVKPGQPQPEEVKEEDRVINLAVGFGKHTRQHNAVVTGDTVGDPLKDTSGPAINILVKLSAIISLVFASSMPNWDEHGYLGQALGY